MPCAGRVIIDTHKNIERQNFMFSFLKAQKLSLKLETNLCIMSREIQTLLVIIAGMYRNQCDKMAPIPLNRQKSYGKYNPKTLLK